MSNTTLFSEMWESSRDQILEEIVAEGFSPPMDPTLPRYDRPDEDFFGQFAAQSYHSETDQRDLLPCEYQQSPPGTPEDQQTFSEPLREQHIFPQSLEDFVQHYGEKTFLNFVLPLSHSGDANTSDLVGEPSNHVQASGATILDQHMPSSNIPHQTFSNEWMALPLYSETDTLHIVPLPDIPTDIMTPNDDFTATQSTQSMSESSISGSPSSSDLHLYGFRNHNGTWGCAYPGCVSKRIFRRRCDLRKHFRYHRKHLFCREAGCPRATLGGFSTEKDRVRHEAKHKPNVVCIWKGCGKVFSRVDNMKDHVRRIHQKISACGRNP